MTRTQLCLAVVGVCASSAFAQQPGVVDELATAAAAVAAPLQCVGDAEQSLGKLAAKLASQTTLSRHEVSQAADSAHGVEAAVDRAGALWRGVLARGTPFAAGQRDAVAALRTTCRTVVATGRRCGQHCVGLLADQPRVAASIFARVAGADLALSRDAAFADDASDPSRSMSRAAPVEAVPAAVEDLAVAIALSAAAGGRADAMLRATAGQSDRVARATTALTEELEAAKLAVAEGKRAAEESRAAAEAMPKLLVITVVGLLVVIELFKGFVLRRAAAAEATPTSRAQPPGSGSHE